MNEPYWTRAYRAVFAALAVAAIIVKYPLDGDSLVTYLSKFTVESNAFGAAVLLGGALLAPRITGTIAWDGVRGAAAMYLLTTGIVYGLLLQGFDNPFTSGRHWTHTVLHQLMPIVIVLDLVVRPFAHRLGWRDALRWTVFPILYLVYSLVRGAIIGWYPYDFIDPSEVGGYGGVALYALGISAGFLAFAFLILWLSNSLHRLPVKAKPVAVPSGSAPS